MIEKVLTGTSTGKHAFPFSPAIAADWRGRHYFYQLRPECYAPSTPRGWFRTTKYPPTFGVGEGLGFYPGNSRAATRTRDRLILSQSVVIDIDGNKVCRWAFGFFSPLKGRYRGAIRPKPSSCIMTSSTTQPLVSTSNYSGLGPPLAASRTNSNNGA